jgi:hypothetical protein
VLQCGGYQPCLVANEEAFLEVSLAVSNVRQTALKSLYAQLSLLNECTMLTYVPESPCPFSRAWPIVDGPAHESMLNRTGVLYNTQVQRKLRDNRAFNVTMSGKHKRKLHDRRLGIAVERASRVTCGIERCLVRY